MKRTYVRLKLEFDSGWRVGSWATSASDVIETLTDQLNDGPMVPGSSIAGTLRSVAREQGTDTELFGPADENQKLTVSQWWILGVIVSDAPIKTRRRTRIDRHRRASAPKGLFEVQEVQGGELTVYLRTEVADPNPLIAVIQAWSPQIGAGRTTGLGRAHVTELVHRTLDLEDRRDLGALLSTSGTPPERVDSLLTTAIGTEVDSPKPATFVEATVRVAFLAHPEEVLRVTSGTQWKGVLRSRVEFIGRSLRHNVCGLDPAEWSACTSREPAKPADATYDKPTRPCAVCRVFGSTEGRGTLEFLDSPWQGEAIEPARMQRNAIDRFTGGARDSALFSQRYEKDVAMPFKVLGHRPTGEEAWVGQALLHALRDLDDGICGIGPEGAVGFGHAQFSDLLVDGLKSTVSSVEPMAYQEGESA